MRLQNPSAKQKGLSGPNADIVDQLLSNKKKRSRPISSSLEFHSTDKTRITTIKTQSSKKPRVKNQQQQPPPQITVTRARGSRGIPRTKLQLEDLEGMSEEDILQALYDDPELAKAAAAAASESNRSQHKEPPPKTTRRQQLSKYPTHVKEMMDHGVPYKQWIFLLVLLGLGIYQLYKALKPPSTPKKKSSPKGSGVPKKTRPVGDKAKRKKTERKKLDDAKQAIREIDALPVSKLADSKSSTANKKKAKVSVTRSTKPAEKSAERKILPESPDSISTDGSSSTTDVVPAMPKVAKEKKSDKQVAASTPGAPNQNGRIEENVQGWQQVGGLRSRPESTQKVADEPVEPVGGSNGVSNKKESAGKSQSEKPSNSNQTATTTEEDTKISPVPASALDAEAGEQEARFDSEQGSPTATEKARRVRKKKTKATSGVAPAAKPEQATTEDDAAIAFKLQKEEEKLAEVPERAESEPEVWKEVTTKKKKGVATSEAATTDPVAVVDESI